MIAYATAARYCFIPVVGQWNARDEPRHNNENDVPCYDHDADNDGDDSKRAPNKYAIVEKQD